MSKKKARRVSVDVSEIEQDLEEFARLEGIPADVWAEMPESQKLLILARRGLQATREKIKEAKNT